MRLTSHFTLVKKSGHKDTYSWKYWQKLVRDGKPPFFPPWCRSKIWISRRDNVSLFESIQSNQTEANFIYEIQIILFKKFKLFYLWANLEVKYWNIANPIGPPVGALRSKSVLDCLLTSCGDSTSCNFFAKTFFLSLQSFCFSIT